MEAVILAGGKGTRLQPYTNEIPKPLVPIGNRPIIEILLRQLHKSGVIKAHIAVNHLADQIVAVLGDGKGCGLEIAYAEEERPLSTVGPIALIKGLPEHFVVANGDVLTDLDVARLFESHIRSGACLTVATQRRSERIDFGVLESDAENQVIGFQEKPQYKFDVSMGIYVFSRRILELVPAGKPYGFDQLILELLKRNEKVTQYPYEGFWLDIGRPDDYERACREWDSIKELLR
jgi:NDP-mannose synthase